MFEAPTHRQLEVLRLIDRGIEDGLPPTIRELCDALGTTSTNAVSDHLRALIKKGCLEKRRRTARGLFITEHGRRALGAA